MSSCSNCKGSLSERVSIWSLIWLSSSIITCNTSSKPGKSVYSHSALLSSWRDFFFSLRFLFLDLCFFFALISALFTKLETCVTDAASLLRWDEPITLLLSFEFTEESIEGNWLTALLELPPKSITKRPSSDSSSLAEFWERVASFSILSISFSESTSARASQSITKRSSSESSSFAEQLCELTAWFSILSVSFSESTSVRALQPAGSQSIPSSSDEENVQIKSSFAAGVFSTHALWEELLLVTVSVPIFAGAHFDKGATEWLSSISSVNTSGTMFEDRSEEVLCCLSTAGASLKRTKPEGTGEESTWTSSGRSIFTAVVIGPSCEFATLIEGKEVVDSSTFLELVVLPLEAVRSWTLFAFTVLIPVLFWARRDDFLLLDPASEVWVSELSESEDERYPLSFLASETGLLFFFDFF